MILDLYAIPVLAIMFTVLVLVIVIRRSLPAAHDAPPMTGPLPRVSVIVAAMNEAASIETAMRSLMALDYPDIEFIAVNDRSTDGTGAILNRLAEEFEGRLRVLHVDTLPAGWLGKCHALHVASAHATGEWLLFTDADVMFAPATVQLALAHATARGADHIALFPRMLWHGYIEAALLSFFTIVFTISFGIWRVGSSSKKAFVGVGAFNMVRRAMYDRFGGHTALRLEVADDLMVGYLVKTHGGRSMAVRGDDTVQVRWREGTHDTVRGIERSGFAGIGFNMPKAIGTVLACLLLLLAPYALLFIAPGSLAFWLSAAAILCILASHAVNAPVHAFPVWIGLLHPVAVVLFAYAFTRSAILTTLHGGLSWRGTRYSVAELKAGRVR